MLQDQSGGYIFNLQFQQSLSDDCRSTLTSPTIRILNFSIPTSPTRMFMLWISASTMQTLSHEVRLQNAKTFVVYRPMTFDDTWPFGCFEAIRVEQHGVIPITQPRNIQSSTTTLLVQKPQHWWTKSQSAITWQTEELSYTANHRTLVLQCTAH